MPGEGGVEVPALPAFEPDAPGEIRFLTENEIIAVEPTCLNVGIVTNDTRRRFRRKNWLILVKLTTILLMVSCSCPEESGRGDPASAVIEFSSPLHVENL